MNDNHRETVHKLVDSIDEYYLASFRLAPDQLNKQMFNVIDQIEKVNSQLPSRIERRLRQYLMRIVNCMENHDYVLLRDILIYEIKVLMMDW